MKLFRKFWHKEEVEINFYDDVKRLDGPFSMPISARPRWRMWFMKRSGRYATLQTPDGEILIRKRRKK